MPGQERSVFHRKTPSSSEQDRDEWDVLAASAPWQRP